MAIESPRPPKPPIQPNATRCTLYAVLNMQNKPNFQDAQMNVYTYYTKAYNNETAFRRGKNKPNSNPISSKPKMNLKSLAGKSGTPEPGTLDLTKDKWYRVIVTCTFAYLHR